MAKVETKVLPLPLALWIAQEDERDRLTREALSDVDYGRVIDQVAVLAWVDSLGSDNTLPVPQ